MFGQTPATQTSLFGQLSSDVDQAPPAFEGHVVEVESKDDSKITNVSVYSGRAEITRSFHLELKVGQNQVQISGLPAVMDRDSLRVEGIGAGTIQEVSVSTIQPRAFPTEPPKVKELKREKVIAEQKLSRATQAIKTLDRYVESLNATTIQAVQLQEALTEYTKSVEKYQEEILTIQDRIAKLDADVATEMKKALEGKQRNPALNKKVSVGIFTEEAGEAEIVLVYAVVNASWSPKYDIRVNMQSNDKSVALVYKCLLTQNTGEDWPDVSLALETVTPTFDRRVPALLPWVVGLRSQGMDFRNNNTGLVKGGFGAFSNTNTAGGLFGGAATQTNNAGGLFGQAPRQAPQHPSGGGLFGSTQPQQGLFGAPVPQQQQQTQQPSLFGSTQQQSGGLFGAPAGQEQPHQHQLAETTAAQPGPAGLFGGMTTANAEAGGGNISATFRVPNKITVPSDNSSHSVTIVKLKLDASLSWVCVPKKDRGVHLGAKIKNTSEYFLLSGPASVYVDGSFISRSNVPSVSPEESFNCPLGLDNSIKIVYRPLSVKLTQSGILNQIDTYQYTRRITIQNTKGVEVRNIKLIDQFPVSEDAGVIVKPVVPALQLPNASTSSENGSGFAAAWTSEKGSSSTGKVNPSVKISDEVVAKWDDGNEEEENIDVAALGKDGKINLICSLPAQGKTNVTLQWQVSAAAKSKIYGLQRP